MKNNLKNVLEICLNRIRKGEAIDKCLTDYPEYRSDLKPLLEMTLKLNEIPRVAPSPEFKDKVLSRLMAYNTTDTSAENKHPRTSFSNWIRGSSIVKPIVPAVLIFLALVIVWFALPRFSPAPVYAAECTLSILSGSAQIQPMNSSTWLTAEDGIKLTAGSRVKTPSDSRTLLTFFDGSTTKLEPDSEVKISKLEYIDQRSVFVMLEQTSGQTWNYVLMNGEEKPYFSVKTPQVTAVADGTAFSTEITPSGQTRISVTEGKLAIITPEGDIRLDTNHYFQTETTATTQYIVSAIPAAKEELVVSTGLSGVGAVRDPNGASTGYLPDGLSFNQITHSKSSLIEGGQRIEISQPLPGEYTLSIRNIADGVIPLDIQYKQDGIVVFQITETLTTESGAGWAVRLRLDKEHGTITGASITSIEPLLGRSPETIVETELAKKRAVPFSSAGYIPTQIPAEIYNPTTETPSEAGTGSAPTQSIELQTTFDTTVEPNTSKPDDSLIPSETEEQTSPVLKPNDVQQGVYEKPVVTEEPERPADDIMKPTEEAELDHPLDSEIDTGTSSSDSGTYIPNDSETYTNQTDPETVSGLMSDISPEIDEEISDTGSEAPVNNIPDIDTTITETISNNSVNQTDITANK
ncbi:FecR domain-containing protein [Chloroflexota bacterium]